MYGMMQLQRKVKAEKFFGGANHKQTAEERELGVSNEELTFREKHGDHRREPLVITDVPEDFKLATEEHGETRNEVRENPSQSDAKERKEAAV
jgi:NADH-quinone oxidoreductase subunit B